MISRMLGSVAVLTVLAGCSTSSPFVISRNIETTPGVNVAQRANGNEVESIALRREGARVNDAGIRACFLQNVVPVENQPGTDILQPDVDTYQRLGNTDTRLGNLHYRATLQTVGGQHYYLFDQLGWQRNDAKEGQENYTPIGAWQNDATQVAYDAVVGISGKLQDCLSQTALQQPVAPATRSMSKARH